MCAHSCPARRPHRTPDLRSAGGCRLQRSSGRGEAAFAVHRKARSQLYISTSYNLQLSGRHAMPPHNDSTVTARCTLSPHARASDCVREGQHHNRRAPTCDRSLTAPASAGRAAIGRWRGTRSGWAACDGRRMRCVDGGVGESGVGGCELRGGAAEGADGGWREDAGVGGGRGRWLTDCTKWE